MNTKGGPWVALLALATLATGMALALAADAQRAVLMPAIASIVVYMAFTLALYQRLRHSLFGEIGFFFLSAAFAYTLMPAATFILADVELSQGWVWEKLSLLLPDADALGVHLWRHVLFMAGTAVGYLLVRGAARSNAPTPMPALENEGFMITLALAIILAATTAVAILSAPVQFYIDHYLRFEHLGWFELRIVYVLLLLKTSAYYVLMAVLFRGFARYRLLAVTAVIAICAYELSYSLGSRIETLSVMLGAGCLYHFLVRPVTLKGGLVALSAIVVLFSLVEVVRMLDFGGSASANLLADNEFGPASEFGAVFFTGYHLYFERSSGSLPPASIAMFFNDLLAVLPFVENEEWHPMYWYAYHYFPDALVPPATIGPIAESAVWGGEIDLALRAVAIGALYALVMRWFLPRRQEWWALVIYSYLFATCIMTLKYSVLYQLSPLVRIIGPGLLVFWLAKRLVGSGSQLTSLPSGRQHSIER